MRDNAARDLIGGGIFLAVVASAMTTHGCLIRPGPHFRQIARDAFLEAICPTGRLAGNIHAPSAVAGLFSKEFLFWVLSAALLVWGLYLWRRGADVSVSEAETEAQGGAPAPRGFGRRRQSSAAPLPPPAPPSFDSAAASPPPGVLAGLSGSAMDLAARIDFHHRLRRMIEFAPHAETEAMLRAKIAALGCDPLIDALAIAPDAMSIEGWQYLADDMVEARRGLDREEAGKPWRAAVLHLVYRNTDRDIFIEAGFMLNAAPAQYDPAEFVKNPSAQREERSRMPEGRYHEARRPTRMRLHGLDALRGVQDWSVEPSHGHLADHVETAKTLAAALVHLRFCQVTERYLASPGLPKPLQPYLSVKTDSRPDTGIIDYCANAVRLVWPD